MPTMTDSEFGRLMFTEGFPVDYRSAKMDTFRSVGGASLDMGSQVVWFSRVTPDVRVPTTYLLTTSERIDSYALEGDRLMVSDRVEAFKLAREWFSAHPADTFRAVVYFVAGDAPSERIPRSCHTL